MQARTAFRRTLPALLLTAAFLAAAISLPEARSAAADRHAPSGTVTWAEAPGDPPDFIFPFLSLRYLKASTVNQFQYLMYRPLYWFGHGRGVKLNAKLSLANPPRYDAARSSVTIHLKGWRWSNGETVDARSVVFWLNMLHADKASFADYVPGAFPDNVGAVDQPDAATVVLHLNGPVNPEWFNANNLSHITPLPMAWDVTADGGAPGSGGCAAAPYGKDDRACDAVYNYLSRKAGFNPDDPTADNNQLNTYASDPLWQVVDGPWRLSRFDAAGHVTMVANPRYSGPRPHFSHFVEVPFASAKAELAALRQGKVDVGYLPRSAIPQPTEHASGSGGNADGLKDYRLSPQYLWAINYVPINVASTANGGQAGAILRQAYVREALNLLVDQGRMIREVYQGYALPTVGPVPVLPRVASAPGLPTKPAYPFNPQRAAKLLAAHGWHLAKGTLRCAHPARCGPGISRKSTLQISLDYASGNPELAKVVAIEVAAWRKAGIEATAQASSYSAVLSTAVPCSAGVPCAWMMEDWGTGWTFAPDYYPSGDAFLSSGSGSNVGSFSDPAVDQLVAATLTTPAPRSLAAYANGVQRAAPLLWQPLGSYSLVEAKADLWTGSPIANPLGQLNPESWYRHR